MVGFLRDESIVYVEKENNPTNLPQPRPIEDFFGYLDQLVYDKGWTAKNTDQLIRRVKSCLKKVDMDVVRATLETVRKKLRQCAEEGPYSINH